MRTSKLIIFLSLFWVLPQLSFGQEDLDLYLKEGAENNPTLKAKFNLYMAALEQTNIVGHLPDPQIAFAYFISPVETRLGPQQFKMSVSQMFPWFGTLDAERNAALERAKVNYEFFEQSKSQLFYNVKMTYYNLYFFMKAISITKENINILNTLKQLAIVKYESGKASIVDEYRVEMELNDLENQLLDLEDKTILLKTRFNQLLNKESLDVILTPDSLWQEVLPISKENILDSILVNNHQVLALEKKLLANEFEETLADKKGNPSFGIGIDYILVGKTGNPAIDPKIDGRDAIVFPKISLSIPIYRTKYNSMVKKVNYEFKSTSYDIEAKKNLLVVLFEKGFNDYLDANRRIALNTKQKNIAKKSLDVLIIDYSTNGRMFEEVLRMERRILRYELALEKGRTDLNASVAFIEFLMGK